MRKYDKWNQLQGQQGEIILKHFLFGDQKYGCDELQVINDDDRIGIVIKEAELFAYKQNVVDVRINGNQYIVEDDLLKIKAIVNKM